MTPITPGFASQPNASPPAALAYALMPTESLAQRRADKQAGLFYQSQLNEAYKQQLDERNKAVTDLKGTIDNIEKLGLLTPDSNRIYAGIAEPWRQKVAGIIKNEYQGDVARFQREKGEYLMGEFNTALATSPLVERGKQSTMNYGLWLKDRQDGKISMGDMDAEYARYMRGERPDLPYAGGYKPPVNLQKSITEGHLPGSEWGVSVKDSKGNHIGYRPVEATADDVYSVALNSLGSPEQARDYVQNKLRYQGGWQWGMKQPDPYDLQQKAIQNRFTATRIQDARNNQAQNIRQQELNRAAANSRAARQQGPSGPNFADRLFGQAADYRQGPQLSPAGYVNGKAQPARYAEEVAGINGDLRDALLTAVGYNEKDVKKTKVDGQEKSTYTVTSPRFMDSSGKNIMSAKDGILRGVTKIDASRVVRVPAEDYGGKRGQYRYFVPGSLNVKTKSGVVDASGYFEIDLTNNTLGTLIDNSNYANAKAKANGTTPQAYNPTPMMPLSQGLNEDFND